MKIAYLNTYNNGSTGRIVDSLKEICQQHGIDAISIYSRGIDTNTNESSYKHHCKLEFYLDGLSTRLFDAHGLGNIFNTIGIIRRLKSFNPDIVHIHNLHGYWVNYPLLFMYLKKNNVKVVWTFHDCWHFTGHCTHFDYVKCENWKNGCHHCIQSKEFPSSLFDFSKRNFILKKKYFTSLRNLIIVTPSEWLKKQVEQSFLNKYEVTVIHNGIDLNVFKPSRNTELRNGILSKGYNAIILGVAASWNERKGLGDIQKLANKRKDWYFVIIGTIRQDQRIPMDNMLYINRTENAKELAVWYSTTDVLIQPTLEDTYPTTNLEAIACGTPVVTYPTGGSEEIVVESGFGAVTNDNTCTSIEEQTLKLLNGKQLTCNPWFELDSKKTFLKYIDVYYRVFNGR